MVQAVATGRVAGLLEGGSQAVGVGQIRHTDLDVDDVLGGQARDRRRADVVDGERQLA
jgi:hypothetical protein